MSDRSLKDFPLDCADPCPRCGCEDPELVIFGGIPLSEEERKYIMGAYWSQGPRFLMQCPHCGLTLDTECWVSADAVDDWNHMEWNPDKTGGIAMHRTRDGHDRINGRRAD